MSKILKFTVNTTYNLQDVGPDYFDGEVEVDDHWAKLFVEQGRAVEVVAAPAIDAETGEGDDAGQGEVGDTTPPADDSSPEEVAEEKSGLDTESAEAVVPKKKK